eukprot:1157924-Pelagomonas_calceolata.AAC.16
MVGVWAAWQAAQMDSCWAVASSMDKWLGGGVAGVQPTSLGRNRLLGWAAGGGGGACRNRRPLPSLWALQQLLSAAELLVASTPDLAAQKAAACHAETNSAPRQHPHLLD